MHNGLTYCDDDRHGTELRLKTRTGTGAKNTLPLSTHETDVSSTRSCLYGIRLWPKER